MPCSGPKDCGEFTLTDALGPFFVENVTNSLELAPEAELEDEDKAVVLQGEVLASLQASSSPATQPGS